MNVLMLNPPYYAKYSSSQRSPGVIKSGVIYYPIWLAYATGVLEQHGLNVRLVDAPAAGLSLRQVLSLVEEFDPRLVVINTSTPSIFNDIDVVQAIKSLTPGVVVALVGPHVSALPVETLETNTAIDAVARGEYDYTIRDLALAVQSGAAWDGVLGLSYRRPITRHNGRLGEIVSNPDRPFITDLDNLPFVTEVYARHLDVRNYFYSITQYPEVALITGRGCPYQCTFCVWPQTLMGHSYRTRSVENVADEFEYIARQWPQVKEVFIEDDTLTVDKQRAVALAQELTRRDVNLPFTANSRADVDPETLYWLGQAGLRLLCVGFESADQTVLDALKKNIKVARFYQFSEDAARLGILVHGCFIGGNPDDTKETLARTLQLAKDLNLDSAQFFPMMVYPGTEAYAWATRNGYLITEDFREWLTPDGLHRSTVSRSDLSADEILTWCNHARRSFYLRPRYVAAKFWQVVSHPHEARRILKSAHIFARHLSRP